MIQVRAHELSFSNQLLIVLNIPRARTSELNPDPNDLPKLDSKDQFLLGDPASSAGSFLGPGPSSGASTPLSSSVPHVPWLRKTEYLSRDGATRSSLSQEVCVICFMFNPLPRFIYAGLRTGSKVWKPRSTSRAVRNYATSTRPSLPLRPPTWQVSGIQQSPSSPPSKPSTSFQTPTSGRTRTTCSGSLSDQVTEHWTFVQFSATYPRARLTVVQLDDPRLDCALLRPMESDGDHFLAYYLTKEDEDAIAFKQIRLTRGPDEPPEEEVRPRVCAGTPTMLISSHSPHTSTTYEITRQSRSSRRCRTSSCSCSTKVRTSSRASDQRVRTTRTSSARCS